MSEDRVEYVVDNVDENIDVTNIEKWKIDSMIQEVKDNNDELKKLENILEDRIFQLKLQFEDKKKTIKKRNYFLLTTLGEYAKTQKLKKAKTQSKYTSLMGDIVIKHASKSVSKPKKDVYDKIEKLYPEYVEIVEEKKVNWKDLKKKFIIQGDNVYDKESGENVSGLLNIDKKDEEIIVK